MAFRRIVDKESIHNINNCVVRWALIEATLQTHSQSLNKYAAINSGDISQNIGHPNKKFPNHRVILSGISRVDDVVGINIFDSLANAGKRHREPPYQDSFHNGKLVCGLQVPEWFSSRHS